MTDRQRESTAKFLYDMAKGVGLIAVVGGMMAGQVSWRSVIVGATAMVVLFIGAYLLEGRGN
jgi:hypothetical protein